MFYRILVLDPLLGISTVQLRLMILKIHFHQWKTTKHPAHEECISLFISVREICQRRKFQGKFTYLAFLNLKKAYNSVPIFNILTYHYGVRGKCFDFLCNLYTSSKAHARFASMLSNEFPIKKRCSSRLSIISNLIQFINQ